MTTKHITCGFTLLCGDDAVLREHVRSEIIQAVKSSQPEALVERYNPGDGDFSSFGESIITPSLLTPMRIFLISELHLLGDKDLDALSGLFAYDLPDACVIMETDKTTSKKSKDVASSKKFLLFIDRFSAWIKKEPSRFAIQEFVCPPDYKMIDWVETHVPTLCKRTISKSAAGYLVEMVGADTSLLYSELQKIDLFLDDKAVIDKKVIDTVCGATRAMTPFELAAALGKKDLGRAIEIIDSVYSQNVYLPLFVSAIFRQFWSMFRISEFAKSNADIVNKFKASLKSYNKSVQEECGVLIGAAAGLFSEKQARSVYPVLVKSGIVDHAMGFERNHYRMIFSMLRDYDIGLKTGKADNSKTGFELFCYALVRVETACMKPVWGPPP
jgi:DNA polymerase III delta subunit